MREPTQPLEVRVAVGALALALDLKLDPAAQHGVVNVVDRQSVHPVAAMELALLSVVANLDPAGGVDAVLIQEFVQVLVRTGFADEAEVLCVLEPASGWPP